MEVTKCKFNPERDLKEVEQFGFIDLKTAFVERCVPSQLAETKDDYNGIDNPDSILGKPSDVFDALQMADNFEKAAAGNNKEEK